MVFVSNTMRCDAMRCDAIQYNAMQCNAMQCNAVLVLSCTTYIIIVIQKLPEFLSDFCLTVCRQVMLCVLHSCSYWGLLNIENWEISSSETLTGRTVRVILPHYIHLISDSLFELRASDLSVLPVNIWCQTTFGIFRMFRKPCNRNVCWTCCKLVSLVKSNFDRYNL